VIDYSLFSFSGRIILIDPANLAGFVHVVVVAISLIILQTAALPLNDSRDCFMLRYSLSRDILK
jgi:hypothetical protein